MERLTVFWARVLSPTGSVSKSDALPSELGDAGGSRDRVRGLY